MKKCICAVLFLIAALACALPAPAMQYDSSWANRIEVTVNNPGSSTLNDYPVRIDVPAKTFIDAGMMLQTLEDIRFSDGTNALPFWISITENMQRYLNNIPVYVKLKTFSPGSNIIYMYFDISKTKLNYPPLVGYTTGSASDLANYCGDGGTTSSQPYSGVNCGKNVFGYSTTTTTYTGLFSYDCSDTSASGWSWSASCTSASSNWVSKNKVGVTPSATPSNAFDLHFRYHYFNNSSGYMNVYFLTQNNSTPSSIDNYCGYKLYVDDAGSASTTQTYNMENVTLTLYKKSSGCGSSGSWNSVWSTTWNPYNNSIQELDIQVTPTAIGIYINGKQKGSTYTRVTPEASSSTFWVGGYVGFNRLIADVGAESGSNSTGDISPLWVIDKFPGSMPAVTFYGEADLAVERIKPTVDSSYTGQNVIEALAQTQVLDDYVYGNTLEKYIYSAFPLASLETQVFKFSLMLKNRGNVSDTFKLQPTLTGDTSSWSIAYDPGSGLVDIPQGTSSPAAYTLSLAAGASTTITYYVMPSNAALFEGGKGSNNMIIDFKLTATKDRSFDNVRYVAHLIGKSGCYWKWKLPITISYTDSNTTGDLLNYQVLVSVSGITQLSDALPNGSDVIFTDANGSYMPFWIKTDSSGNPLFNNLSGTGSFWVQVPRICSSTASPQGPSCSGTGQTTIYMWWGNSNYATSLSSSKNTFDLWEDWQKMDASHSWTAGKAVGCPVNKYLYGTVQDPRWTSECDSAPEPNRAYDINQWLNYPYPPDSFNASPFNWWLTQDKTGKLDGQAAMGDKGTTEQTSDFGPILAGGDLRWKSYEVLYSLYGEYNTYPGNIAGVGNPLYDPVYFQDAGNGWGLEQFDNEFIFRPFGNGLDWTWQYQVNAGTLLGTFPAINKRYYVKTKLFQNPLSSDGTCSNSSYTTKATCQTNGGVWTPNTHLRLFIAPSTPTDIDSNGSPFVEITTAGNNSGGGGYIPDPAFSINGGMIGFGGWYGGFSYDSIRVRKYTEPEPACAVGAAGTTTFKPVVTLSAPNLTSPLMNHRPVLLSATVTPWAWTGNLTAIYADCYISGDCQSGENSTQPGTISLWGKVDNNTPMGFGDQLAAAVAGDNNRATINDASWKTNGRYMFTAYDSDSNGRISCTTTPGDCLAFGTNTLTTTPSLITMLGVTTLTDAQNLVRFVRGQYVSGFARSDTRNKCSSGHADTCQWKLADVIHSNPLVVGIPNMLYADTDYTTFTNNNNARDLVAYFGTNEGMFHAARMATYNAAATPPAYAADATATELWAFIPNQLLGNLGRTTDTLHEYMVDLKARAIDIKSAGAYKTVLVAGLRSGGQSFFAMDVTNPQSPQLMWEINPGLSSDSSAFLNVGKAWTAPAMGRLCESTPCDATNTGNRWVAIVGSGFSPNDIDNLSKTAYLSIIDLQTGAFIKQIQVSTKPGNITTDIAVTRDNNGYLQKMYFGDYYGAVWRIDLTTTGNVSAILGATTLNSSYMLFQPSDYSTSNINTTGAGPIRPVTSQPRIAYAGPNQLWIYFGTGVYDEYNAAYPYQRFYGLQDGATTYLDTSLVDMTLSTATNASKLSWFIGLGQTDVADVQLTGTAVASCVSACLAQSADNTSNYCNSVCYTTQANTKDRNERVLNTPEIFGGFIFFGTYTPINAPCADGNARFYAVNYTTGGTVSGLMMNASQQNVRSLLVSSGGGIPSSPLIFTGKSGGGQVVAAGLIDISTGQMVKVMLNPNSFTDVFSILWWRQVR